MALHNSLSFVALSNVWHFTVLSFHVLPSIQWNSFTRSVAFDLSLFDLICYVLSVLNLIQAFIPHYMSKRFQLFLSHCTRRSRNTCHTARWWHGIVTLMPDHNAGDNSAAPYMCPCHSYFALIFLVSHIFCLWYSQHSSIEAHLSRFKSFTTKQSKTNKVKEVCLRPTVNFLSILFYRNIFLVHFFSGALSFFSLFLSFNSWLYSSSSLFSLYLTIFPIPFFVSSDNTNTNNYKYYRQLMIKFEMTRESMI